VFPFPRITALLLTLVPGLAAAADWPQWRGPALDGTSPERGLPLRWGVQENVAWKLVLPAGGASTPVISGDHVYLTVPEGEGSDLSLWCVGRTSGKVLWKRPLGAGNVKVRKGDLSSPSPVTDGKRVWALTGTGVMKAFDVEGRELWGRDLQKEYGKFGLNHGYGSSPLLEGDALYVQVLHGMKTTDPSYVLRIDALTGKTRWRVERPTPAKSESPDAYTTPAIVRRGAETEIVITGGDVVTSHDPATGKELWRSAGLNPTGDPYYRIVASPLVVGDLVIAPTRVRPLIAIRAGGRGDVTESRRAWSFDNGPDVPTPVSDGTHLYVVNDKGIVWCLDVQTGKLVYGPTRLPVATYSASPVLADGRIYATSEDGRTSIFKAGPVFELLAENQLDDFTLSTPAIAGGRIFIRTAGALYCIGPS
jgi:outer membrane protein assembly factor BamB